MLQLSQVIPGKINTESPAQAVDVLRHDGRSYVIYASGLDVIVLDEDLSLCTTLSFSEGFPARTSSSASNAKPVVGVQGDDKTGTISAWKENLLVVWIPRISASRPSWKILTSLTVRDGIVCYDQNEGTTAIGHSDGLEIWERDPKAEVVVWNLIWENRTVGTVDQVSFSPLKTHLSFVREGGNEVLIHSLNRQGVNMGLPQSLKHPSRVERTIWRRPRDVHSGIYLYTTTLDSVFRIFSPVLDDPQYFQLVFSLCLTKFYPSPLVPSPSFTPVVVGKGKGRYTSGVPSWVIHGKIEGEEGREGETEWEGLDTVCWVERDGWLYMTYLADMDRRPPTLLRVEQPIMISNLSSTLLPQSLCSSLAVLPSTSSRPTSLLVTPTGTSLSRDGLLAYDIHKASPLSKNGRPTIRIEPRKRRRRESSPEPEHQLQLSQRISYFSRTPNGGGLMVVGDGGQSTIWTVSEGLRNQASSIELTGKAQWIHEHISRPPSPGALHNGLNIDPAHLSAVYAGGRGFVCSDKDGIFLRHINDDGGMSEAIRLPGFGGDQDISVLLASSDVDDGVSPMDRRSQQTYIVAACADGDVYSWMVDGRRPVEDTHKEYTPRVHLVSKCRLESTREMNGSDSGSSTPQHILPVDPMGWHTPVIDWAEHVAVQDMLLTVSEDGLLEFWKPVRSGDPVVLGPSDYLGASWERTGYLFTGKKGILKVRCSSRKKTALVVRMEDGMDELSIWDSKFGEFSSGLDHVQTYGQPVNDLDWTTTPDLQSILAVGFSDKILLLCEQRMNYVSPAPAWETLFSISVSEFTGHSIRDSIWLADGTLAIGAGNQIFLYSRHVESSAVEHLDLQDGRADSERVSDLFELVVLRNGPLPDYHPQNLAQCMNWNKVDLVRSILLKTLAALEDGGLKTYQRVPAEEYWKTEERSVSKSIGPASKKAHQYGSLFDTKPSEEDASGTNTLTASSLTKLSIAKQDFLWHGLSIAEHSRLILIGKICLQIEDLRRSLDLNGLRYLSSLRLYIGWSRGQSDPSCENDIDGVPRFAATHDHRERISVRSVVWATHSENQDMLLQATGEVCEGGKMQWRDAQKYGVFMWLRNKEQIRWQIDVIARHEYLTSNRDPTSCSLFYFALGKKTVVHGLWRQATGHKEQQAMLRFLSNNFDEPRWKTAAMKNAYALLAKQRYQYAAAFFVLGGSPKDAINVCLKHLKDLQLAIAIARSVEDEAVLLRSLLRDQVMPIALAGGHRWLASWALWTLGEADLAGRALLIPFRELADACGVKTEVIGEPENDDPSLALLLQYLRATSKVSLTSLSGDTEFNFVLHNARIFCRMGCHNLAIALVRDWQFTRPVIIPAPKKQTPVKAPTPSSEPKLNGKAAAIEAPVEDIVVIEDPPKKAGKIGMGLTSDSTQGAAEFDMGSFF